jgi:hypothetical protein
MLEEIIKYSVRRMMASGMNLAEIISAESTISVLVTELQVASLWAQAGAIAAGAIPIAAWVGAFVALGAPYAQARAIVKGENFQSGFSQGFVMALLKWEWRHAVARFGRFSPGQKNPFDESLSFEGANAYNTGLKAGFTHGLSLSKEYRKMVLTRIKNFSRGTKPGNWDRASQIAYVIELAAAARLNKIFKSE